MAEAAEASLVRPPVRATGAVERSVDLCTLSACLATASDTDRGSAEFRQTNFSAEPILLGLEASKSANAAASSWSGKAALSSATGAASAALCLSGVRVTKISVPQRILRRESRTSITFAIPMEALPDGKRYQLEIRAK